MSQTHPKPLPTDVDFYIKRTKERASPNAVVADKLNSAKDQEISDTLKEVDRIRAQKLLKSVQEGQGTASNPVLSKLFEGKTTEQITTMLATLTPEALDNLTKLASRFENNPLTMVAPATPEKRSDEMTILLLKYILDDKKQPQQGGLTLEGVAALITALNSGRAQAPPQSSGTAPMDVLKLVMELNRPIQEQLKTKDKELIDARLREMEARMPPDLADQIKYVKEMAPMLGLGSQTTNELDLKLEQMREDREVDLKRLDWEQEKWKMESEADMQKWTQIGKILEGPLGDVIKSFGNAGADRVRGNRPATPSNSTGKQIKAVQTQCPSCGEAIYVDAEADTALCGKCGAILQKQGGAVPAPPVPQEPTHVDAPTSPKAAPAAEEAEEEEEEEEEENKDGLEENKQPSNKPNDKK